MKLKFNRPLGILTASLVLSGVAQAATLSMTIDSELFGTGGGGDASNLTPELVTSTTFSLPAILSLDSVGAELAHDFGSDVTIELISPTGSTFLIAEGDGPAENPHQGGGDADALGTGVDFTLASVESYEIFPAGTTGTNWLDGGAPLPAGSYDQRLVASESWPTGPFAAGDWTYNLYDSWDTADAGSVGDISISFTPVPEPSSALLVALVGFGLMVRRRR